MGRTKEFRDPVHGYIAIPEEYCASLIDTPIFQRLREIEQTGMRILFPSARHCRFSHSLGTYHLGKHAFGRFQENAAPFFAEVTPDQWNAYRRTFEIACLLHDCAHAPFSHSFENYYDHHPRRAPSRLDGPLVAIAARNDATFEGDLTSSAALPPAAHEKASALVLLTHFGDAVRELRGDPALAARMVLGCTHLNSRSDNDRLENCLILLLNSKAIDVDKLDYIVRDTWASGINNVSIDLHRLFASLTYDPVQHRLAYKRSALSVLQSVIDGRNYLHRWVFSHHKVVYNQYLLRTAVEKLARLLAPQEPDDFLLHLFNVNTFARSQPISAGAEVYLPTDGDILAMLKRHVNAIPEARELLFRAHARKPLWKTATECRLVFANRNAQQFIHMATVGADALNEMVDTGAQTVGFVVEPIKESFVTIDVGDILVTFEGQCHSFDTLLGVTETRDPRQAFYVYAPSSCIGQKAEFITRLQAI